MKKITLIDVKTALKDSRFRKTLPDELAEDVNKYLQNPGCGCNLKIYKNILKKCGEQLKNYYPGRELSSIKEEVKKLSENHWTVINCHIDELEDRLKKLPRGRKQLAVTRFEDQVTVVVNELDIIY